MKDNFSSASENYARYRPAYPKELYEWLEKIIPNKTNAWDCGTGNGQIASELVKYFVKVFATDISEKQLDEAVKHERIEYSVQPAETTNFPNDFFDLVIVGQAVHWFDFDKFYKEVNRTLKKDGLIVITGYNRPVITPEIDTVINFLYTDVVGKYWDAERKYIDGNYKMIPFPFNEIPSPRLKNLFGWSFDHLIGYLKTWSAVKHFIKSEGFDPVEKISDELKNAWGNRPMREVQFPVLLRTGKLT